MALKEFVQESINDGQYVAVISLDVKEAFDAAWWPGILVSLRNLRCPGNLYKLRELLQREDCFYNKKQWHRAKENK